MLSLGADVVAVASVYRHGMQAGCTCVSCSKPRAVWADVLNNLPCCGGASDSLWLQAARRLASKVVDPATQAVRSPGRMYLFSGLAAVLFVLALQGTDMVLPVGMLTAVWVCIRNLPLQVIIDARYWERAQVKRAKAVLLADSSCALASLAFGRVQQLWCTCSK